MISCFLDPKTQNARDCYMAEQELSNDNMGSMDPLLLFVDFGAKHYRPYLKRVRFIISLSITSRDSFKVHHGRTE